MRGRCDEGRSVAGLLVESCLETAGSESDGTLSGGCQSDTGLPVNWCFATVSGPVRLVEDVLGQIRSDLSLPAD